MTTTAAPAETIRFPWEVDEVEYAIAASNGDGTWRTEGILGGKTGDRTVAERALSALEANRLTKVTAYEAEAADPSLRPEIRARSARLAESTRTEIYHLVSRRVTAWTVDF